MRVFAMIAVVGALAGCGGGERGVTVYLEHRLGPDGPRGQIAPVLDPVQRDARPELSAADQALLQLWQGATPTERALGMRGPVEPRTGLRLDRVADGTAFVLVLGQPLDVMGVAAVVFSLTELDEIARVRVCCLHRHDGTRIFVHARESFGGWQGEPCAQRRENRCLRDR